MLGDVFSLLFQAIVLGIESGPFGLNLTMDGDDLFAGLGIGGALVTAPDAADPSQDLIVARIYLSASQQKLKSDDSQIGIDWGFDVY